MYFCTSNLLALPLFCLFIIGYFPNIKFNSNNENIVNLETNERNKNQTKKNNIWHFQNFRMLNL